MNNEHIKVMLVDDHAVVRAGYKFLLDDVEDMEVVGEAGSGEEAIDRFGELAPDVLVMDLAMPGIGGAEAIRRIMKRSPESRLLVFSMHENPAFVEQVLEAGVAGYISKNSSPEVLVEAVRSIAAGGMYIDANVTRKLLAKNNRSQGSAFASLSSREFQVLCLFAAGRGVEKIASELSISSKTVANYLTLIKDKLEVSNTQELIRLAISEGLVTV